MPIRIPDSLPATSILEKENIFVMTEYRAFHQDIRPLKLLILNLMPTKIVTETQLLRKLSNSPLQVEVELLQTASHTSQNTDAGHLSSFYTTFDKIKHRKYDGQTALMYVAWYGAGRALIEGLRTDSLWWGNFRVSQVLAAASCAVALIVLLILSRKEHKPEDLFVNRLAARKAAEEAEETAE